MTNPSWQKEQLCAGGETKIAREPAILAELVLIDKSIHELFEALGNLCSRLEKVSNDSIRPPASESEKPESFCVVQNKLERIKESIEIVISVLQMQASVLEI